MPTVTNSRIIKYNVSGGRCRCGVEIDNDKEWMYIVRDVEDTAPAKAAALTLAENSVLQALLNAEDEESILHIHENLQDWDGLPEPRRQRVAQRAVRELVMHARKAKDLKRQGGVYNPEAIKEAMSTRRIISNVWDVQTGDHVSRAAYFNLAGPGPGTEYGDVNAFVNDLQSNANSHFSALVTWLDTFPEPQEISSE